MLRIPVGLSLRMDSNRCGFLRVERDSSVEPGDIDMTPLFSLLLPITILLGQDSVAKIERDFFKILGNASESAGPNVDDLWPFLERSQALVEESESDEEEYLALETVLRVANFRFAPTYQRNPEFAEIYAETLERMVDDFVDYPLLGRIVLSLNQGDQEILNRIAAETTCPDVEAALLYLRVGRWMDAHRVGTLVIGKKQELVSALHRISADYPNIPDALGRGTYGELAARSLFEIEHLSVGCVAPDIEGADLDGVDFKLSSYRGKVVLLDFWGHW
jgi:hypothetical protein